MGDSGWMGIGPQLFGYMERAMPESEDAAMDPEYDQLGGTPRHEYGPGWHRYMDGQGGGYTEPWSDPFGYERELRESKALTKSLIEMLEAAGVQRIVIEAAVAASKETGP